MLLLGLLASLAQAAALSPRTWYRAPSTPHGDVTGSPVSAAGTTYTVPYARPPIGTRRFADPVPIDRWSAYAGGKTQKVCPQVGVDASEYSEDCLYLTVHQPNGADRGDLPVFFWIHGGSFRQGGINDLDALAFATKQNMIVVTVQYRLGVLGWTKYDALGLGGNLGLKDIIMALKFVQTDIASYGGDPTRVTIAGQSSGAEIVKSLLVTPSATSLFARAIMHSAPLDSVDQSPAVANEVGAEVLNSLGCKDVACLRDLSLDKIIATDGSIASSGLSLAGALGPEVAFAEPLHTVVDGSLVTRSFREVVESGGRLEGGNKELIFTTVKNEACEAVDQVTVYESLDSDDFDTYAGAFFASRLPTIDSSGLYDPAQLSGSDATRLALVSLATDFTYTCPVQRAAVKTANGSSNSQKVYLGEFDLGVPSASADCPLCDGLVGHEDDIYVLFDRKSSNLTLNTAQKALRAEVQERWGSFARNGNPTARGYAAWPTVSASQGDLNVLVLGGASSGKSTIRKSQRAEDVR
ncbi:hypothetical protein JCM10213v2_003752 [Rhodosporidiobolus nylandii]